IDMSNMLHQAAKPQASSWSFDSNAQKSIPKVTHNWQYDMDGEKRGLSQSESANVGLIWGGSCDDNSPLFC
ncbi:hypothetical protein KKB55_10995, partial [Myxococcota bacterium]|nr:hypothetical protein [Myxococcota bacterium]